MEEPIHYFAYGSNLHPLRIGKRIDNIRLITTHKLSSYQLKFNKHGQDDSAKCNIEFTGLTNDYVHGVIYELDFAGLKLLDEIEDLNAGYQHKMIQLPVNGLTIDVLTYIAMPDYVNDRIEPFHWYKQLVLEGMLFHRFEKEYISQTERMVSRADLNIERKRSMQHIVEEIKIYNFNSMS